MYYVKVVNKRYMIKTIAIKQTIEQCIDYIEKNCSVNNNYIITDSKCNIIKALKGGN